MGIDNLYRIVYIESKFLSEVIEMDISNTISAVKVSGSSSSSVNRTSEKNKWQLTDSLKEKIVELAKKDAKNNIYMGNEFMNLRKAEVAKVALNRAALIGKFNQLMSPGNMGDMKEIQEADKRWLCILFGIPYEAEYQGEGAGSAIHIYNEGGEEVITYTQGVGWHEKETKAETDVHSALKSAYYEAYHDARRSLNTGTNVETTNENVVVQSNFDMKA